MIRAVIIDDEEKAIILLRKQLARFCPDVEVVAQAQRIPEALHLIDEHRPQLLFLDIEMPGGSGFDLLDNVKDRNFHVIFVTAHSEFALKAFQFSVADYLLKPVNRELLIQAVKKVKKLIDTTGSSPTTQTIRINSTDGVVFIPVMSIIRMSAEGPYTHLYVDGGKHYMTSHHLKQFEDNLDSGFFLRIHRSHLVNRTSIKSFHDRQGILIIEMADGYLVEVPRRNKAEVMELLKMNIIRT